MITDLKELRVRLETHFDIIADENEEPIALGMALLSAIDLLSIMEKGNWTTVKQVLEAWESRDESGKAKPKIAAVERGR